MIQRIPVTKYTIHRSVKSKISNPWKAKSGSLASQRNMKSKLASLKPNSVSRSNAARDIATGANKNNSKLMPYIHGNKPLPYIRK